MALFDWGLFFGGAYIKHTLKASRVLFFGRKVIEDQ